MALPDLIEIVPLPGPVHAHITVPGSKSITTVSYTHLTLPTNREV